MKLCMLRALELVLGFFLLAAMMVMQVTAIFALAERDWSMALVLGGLALFLAYAASCFLQRR